MKRFLLFWTILSIILVAPAQERNASNRNSNSGANEHSQSARETHVTPTQALNVGYTFMRTGNNTRGNSISKQTMQIVYTGRAIDSLTLATTDCYYVFSLQPKGFVIVAADDRVEPILGYSYDNNFVVESMPDHVRGWLGHYEKQIEAVVKQNIAPEAETTTKWSQLKSGQAISTRSGESVGPLLTTQWDQWWPYNALCPDGAPTGCVATTMGMIMHYWGYPIHGNGFHTFELSCDEDTVFNFNETTFDWANMPDRLTDTSTQEEIDAVSTLLWHCGVAVDMQYSPSGSGAFDTRVLTVLRYNFGYSDEISLEEKNDNVVWLNRVKENLDLNKPVYICGYDINSGEGHAFVCDGYDNNDFLHINWGWGYGDGFFAIDAFNVNSWQFNYQIRGIFDISPRCDYGTVFSVSVSNANVDMGTVSASGTYSCGSSCTITAIANDGYQFDYWTEEGEYVSKDATYTFNVTEDRVLVAHFRTQSYSVDVVSNPSSGGKISGVINTVPLMYDNYDDIHSLGWQGGVSFYWGHMYPIEKLHGLGGTALTKVGIYDKMAFSGEILIYQSGDVVLDTTMISSAHQILNKTLVYRQNFSCPGSHNLYEIPLVDPVAVDTTKNLWIVIHNFDGEIVASYCNKDDEPNGKWISFDDGQHWYNSYPYGVWIIRGYFQNAASTANFKDSHWLGEFDEGVTCELTAVPDDGWSFVNWIKNGTVVSTDSNYSFVVNENSDLTATFTIPCNITVTTDPSNGGNVVGGGIYYYGDTCTLVATPTTAEGYQFYCWEENGERVSTDETYSFVVLGNHDIVAKFGFPLTISASVNDSIAGSVVGVGTYNYGDECNVCAINQEGYQFKYWIEGSYIVSRDSCYGFEITSNRELIAVFDMISSSVYAIAQPFNGQICGNPNATLLCLDNGTYVNNGCVSDTGSMWGLKYPVSLLKDLHGKYLTKVRTYDCWAYTGTAMIYKGGDSIPETLVSQQDFQCFSSEKMIDIPLHNPVEIDSTENLWIIFRLSSYSLTGGRPYYAALSSYSGDLHTPWYSLDGGITWNVSSFVSENLSFLIHGIIEPDLPDTSVNHSGIYFGGEYYNGQTCTLLAIPDDGWHFDSWTENGIVVSSDSVLSFIVTRDRRLTAQFSRPFVVSASSSSNGTGIINGEGTYSNGEQCVLLATPLDGYSFVKWTEDGEVLSCDPELSFLVTSDRNIVAHFAPTDSICGIIFNINWALGFENNFLVVNYNDGTSEHLTAHTWTTTQFQRLVINGSRVSLSWIPGEGSWQHSVSILYEDSTLIYEGQPGAYDNFQKSFLVSCEHQPIYVVPGGTGNGSSWTNAMGNLQEAMNLKELEQGDVWVAQGIYYGDGISENAFVIPDGVHVYGGFAGTEPADYDLSLRDFTAHPTILDGQHAQRTLYHDWTWGQLSFLDGFTIQNGHSDLGGNVVGGGPRLQVTNCIIRDGVSEGEAGGLYNVTVQNSVIVNNTSPYWGSAMEECEAYNCIITGNTSSGYGYTTSWCTLTNCIVWNNTGYHSNNGSSITYSAMEGQEVWGDGNIMLAHNSNGTSPDSNYVRFMDPDNGDFRLMSGSACINAGTPDTSELGLPSVDLQGLPRVLDDRIDMGAYEYYPVPVVDAYDTICEGNSVVFFDSVCNAAGSYVLHANAENVTLDTLHVLHLSVSQPTFGDTTAVACESFTWYGTTYTESGIYTSSSSYWTNAAGCDSVVTLHLTINQPVNTTVSETACESFTWNGNTYTQSDDYTQTFSAANGCDSVVTLHLTIHQPTTGDTTAVACESFTWYGTTYTESGNYTISSSYWTNAAGCDSIVTLHLTINNPVNTSVTETACESFSWNGNTYTQSGDYPLTLTAANGCDSVVTLHLTINQPTTGDTTAVACESFTWYGTTYTESGNYTTSSSYWTNAAGCDSIVTLHLTINQPVNTTVTETVCESFTWNGTTYTQSDDYTQTFSAANGCDSVVTLHLTIHQPTTGDTTAVACESFTWYGTTYTESGNYTTSSSYWTNAAGCDSIVTLHLTINQPVNTTVSETACESFTWNGTTYTQSGDYPLTLTAANGCDSVVTLHLTINQPTTGDTTAVACESFTWYGTTYTESGNYTTSSSYWTNAAGCDSIVTLHLTINQPVNTTVTETVCESFTWNGTTYTVSGDYTYSHPDVNGCTQVDTLHLTVNNPVHTAVTETACESFTWNGTTYIISGDYTYSHTDDNGCTQVDTLHLTIFNDETSEFSIVTEDSCYTWNAQSYCASGDYTQTLQTVHGCDSVVTLHLTITVGVDNYDGFDFKVYPNPTSNIVNVQCTMNNVQAETVEIRLYDAYGRLLDGVETGRAPSLQTVQIDLSRYASGVYFLKAVADGKVVAVRKTIKN